MKCSNCGVELAENSKFCNACGFQIESATQNDEKRKLIYDLEIGLPIYKKLAEYSEKIEKVYEKKNKKTSKLLAFIQWLFVWSAIAGFIIGPICAITGRVTSMTVNILVYTIAIIITLVIKSKVKKNKNIACDKEVEQIQLQMRQYIEDNNCAALYRVPEKYRYFIAVNYILECLKNERANDLKEALNLYEEQMHRWQMEGYQQQLLAMSQAQLKASQLILLTNW